MNPKWTTWPHLSGVTILDILLVAILIYQFLMLVRGTRAAPMLVGVAVVALGFYFARLGELTHAELAAQHAAAVCGVRADRGVPVGNSARAGEPGQPADFSRALSSEIGRL